jgi:hypothetical protein
VLAVAPASATHLGPGLVPTAGSWQRTGGVAHFTPRFAVVPGTTYAVLGRADDRDANWLELARVDVPATGQLPRASVESIDPGVDEVPANLLRFSVQFSAEMDEGSAAGRIRLLDETGAELPGTLMDMPPELWDRARRRLTLLLEPGRIKRGLQPNLQAGPPLREGGDVTLVVGSGIRDANGSPLLAEVRRTFRVGAPIRSRVDPARWAVQWPGENSSRLVVRFDRPLDRALVSRHLQVIDRNGHPVAGDARLDRQTKLWTFTAPESGDGWTLRVDALLEDLAGNSVRRVFDRDLQRPEDDSLDATEVILVPAQG